MAVEVTMYDGSMAHGVADIAASMRRLSLVGMLGWQDVRQRYRRSALGPFWLTLSMGIMIGTMGVVFGQIFKSPPADFLPFLSVGMILWGFISTVITEGCVSFITAESIVKQLPIPLFVHILRMAWRSVLIFAHNIVILPLVLLAVGRPLSWVSLLCIPGFLLVVVNLLWIALVLGVLCARYRDMPQIVNSVLQVIFYVTPIMWMPSLLPERTCRLLLQFNPMFHLVEVIRAPLLGQSPTMLNWVSLSGLAAAGWLLAIALFGRYKGRIAYWL